MTDVPVLAVEDLHVSYGPIKAVRGCTLHVHEGESVAVVGANGAGKTTLLRAISNMLPWTEGSVLFQGASIRAVVTSRLAQAGILHLPEDRGVIGTLSVWENLQLAYDIQPSERPFVVAVEEVFEHFPRLKERRLQQAGSMSGGEQQMLALSRALVSVPKILLLDEPSLGLSPLMVREAYRVLRMFKNRGMAILLVEQNVRAALRFAHRAYVLRQGIIVKQGDAKKLAVDAELFGQYLGVN